MPATETATIRTWLLDYLSQLLQLPAVEIAADDPLAAYGLDSSGAAGLAGDLGRWLGRKLEADIVYRFPTVDALSAYLSAEGQ